MAETKGTISCFIGFSGNARRPRLESIAAYFPGDNDSVGTTFASISEVSLISKDH